MSELSELYATQYEYDFNTETQRYDGAMTYTWGDNENYPDYYQSFVKYPQRGYIDQSIFGFKRMTDGFSLGAWCSQVFCKDENGQNIMTNNMYFHFEKYPNTAKKIQVALTNANSPISQTLTPSPWQRVINGYDLLHGFQYSPNSVYMGTHGYAFASNFIYNNYCLIPKFDVIYTDNNQLARNLSYNQIDQNRPFFVWALYVGYGYGGSIPQLYPCFVQYIGRMRGIKMGGGWTYAACAMDSEQNVVIELMGHNPIFGFLATGGADLKTHYSGLYPTQTMFIDIEPILTETTVFSGTRFWGVTLANCVTILNRLGFYWTKEATYDGSPLGTHCTDPNISVPVIDEDTHTVTDTVLTGTQIAEYALAHPENILAYDTGAIDYKGDSYRDFANDYNSSLPTTEEADEINLNEPVIATSGGNSVWLMNEAKLKEFFTYLWNPDGSIFDDIVHAVALLGENPMDSVISCRFFPLNLSQVFGSKFDSQYRTVVFGRYPSEVTARLLTSSNVAIYDVCSFNFNDSNMFRDFRDYEPYSQYSLYIPFVGIIPLSAIECVNTVLSVKMIVDLITGSCTAVVFTNDVPYKYLDGMIGIEVPVTGRNMAQYGQQILSAALGGAGGGIAVGNKSGAFSTAKSIGAEGVSRNMEAMSHNVANMSYGGASSYGMAMGASALGHGTAALASAALPAATGAAFGLGGAIIGGAASALINNPTPQSAGSNAPAMGLAKPLYPYLIVQRSDSWIPENYNKLYGRFLQRGGKVGDFLGFSTFGNVNVDGISGATNNEKVLITELLTKGVYL